MPTKWPPEREADLVAALQQLSSYLETGYASVGVTQLQATDLKEQVDSFVAAWTTANNGLTRSPANISAKNAWKASALLVARQVVAQAQVFPGTTNAIRDQMGIPKRGTPRHPINAPTEAPTLEIIERFGTIVRAKIHGGTGPRRARPEGCAGASIFQYVGALPPVSIEDWKWVANTTKTVFDVEFDVELPAGTVVYLTAFWYSPTAQSGPGCSPVQAILAGGGMQQAA